MAVEDFRAATMSEEEQAAAYRELRQRAEELGFPTVGEALRRVNKFYPGEEND